MELKQSTSTLVWKKFGHNLCSKNVSCLLFWDQEVEIIQTVHLFGRKGFDDMGADEITEKELEEIVCGEKRSRLQMI